MGSNTLASRAEECASGKLSPYICFDCADKYSHNRSYSDPLTVHTNICYICEESKTVGPSKKLMGFYKRMY